MIDCWLLLISLRCRCHRVVVVVRYGIVNFDCNARQKSRSVAFDFMKLSARALNSIAWNISSRQLRHSCLLSNESRQLWKILKAWYWNDTGEQHENTNIQKQCNFCEKKAQALFCSFSDYKCEAAINNASSRQRVSNCNVWRLFVAFWFSIALFFFVLTLDLSSSHLQPLSILLFHTSSYLAGKIDRKMISKEAARYSIQSSLSDTFLMSNDKR